jgi:predicted mannosyl-3-phosphoglycerate phosphatase (HAD superfamily)
MANFADQLKTEVKSNEKAKLQYTENGALGHATSGKNLLDMNFRVASYRSKSQEELIRDFNLAFNEDKQLAVKWLFFVRDVREGIGERDLFRTVFKHLISTNKTEHAEELIKAISEFGRWDDVIFSTWGTQYENIAFNEFKNQLEKDLFQFENGSKGTISLLAKWAPRENTSNKERVAIAHQIVKKLGWSSKQYRKTLSTLNRHLNTIEVKTSAKEWNGINYETVPSLANLKYKNAFLRNDEDRRREYLGKLSKGEVKMNMSVGFPHDIVHSYIGNGRGNWGYRNTSFVLDEALEGAWKNLPNFELGNTIVVGDSSGSMTTPVGNTQIQAIEVAHALGIYCGDHCSGAFHNKMITFSENPKYLEWEDSDTLANKLTIAFSHSEVANTNIEKVFRLILNTAVKNHCKQDEIPGSILIISDMEFDSATTRNSGKTLFQNVEKQYTEEGYTLPRLVFWNVNSRTSTVPVQENDNGVALVSGFSPNIVKMVMSNKTDPFEVLKEQLLSERYKDIIW